MAQRLEVTRTALVSYRREVFQGISREVEASTSDQPHPPSYYAVSAHSAAAPPGQAPPPSARGGQSTTVASPETVDSTSSPDPVWGNSHAPQVTTKDKEKGTLVTH
ncbi:hypothetical protein H0H87_007384 [Tephrocybe sp. NHM501043]|nr:hypothetical protein H0H87_007384 [Tephrocybe sp. NHM501043]